MATTVNDEDAPPTSAQEKWDGNEEGDQNSRKDLEPLSNGERETAPAENGTAPENRSEEPRSGGVDQDGKEDYRSSAPATESGGNHGSTHPEKRMKVLIVSSSVSSLWELDIFCPSNCFECVLTLVSFSLTKCTLAVSRNTLAKKTFKTALAK